MGRYYSEAEKNKILSEFSRSGMNKSQFCRKSGVAESTLYKWQKKRGEISTEPAREGFIELCTKESYELKIGAVTLRVPLSASAQKISELIKALQC